jgi:hypothetical protein
MTAKSKPRKGATKAAPVKPKPKKLLTRHKSPDMDDDYRVAEIDSTYEKLRGLLSVHDCELDMLANRLTELRETRTLAQYAGASWIYGHPFEEGLEPNGEYTKTPAAA